MCASAQTGAGDERKLPSPPFGGPTIVLDPTMQSSFHAYEPSPSAVEDHLMGALRDEIGAQPDERSFGALCEACRESGGVAWADDLDRRLHARKSAEERSLARLIASRQVLAFEWRGTCWILMAQFERGSLSLKPQFLDAWSELAGDLEGWQVAAWFARSNTWLGGQRPIDLIDSDLTTVLRAARADRFNCGANE